jgi:hypothetical protein
MLFAPVLLSMMITGQHEVTVQISDVYWLLIGAVDVVDLLTSWDDPPWRRVKTAVSERIQKLLK